MANQTKTKRQPKTNAVTVTQNITTSIQVGRDSYLMKATEDGRGVRLENGTDSIFIPNGEAGKAIVKNLTNLVGASAPVAKRRRRTKAEIAAANASNQPQSQPQGEGSAQ